MALGARGRPDPYPTVPDWSPVGDPRPHGGGTVRVARGAPQLLRRLDQDWSHLTDPDSVSAQWSFEEGGRGRLERWVVVDDADGRPLAVWLDHNALVCTDAYRLDFLKVRPDKYGQGLGQLTVDYVRHRARTLGASRIVFQSTSYSHKWWLRVGATTCADWRGSASQPNLQIAV